MADAFKEMLAQIRASAGESPEVLSTVDALETEYVNTVTQFDGATVRLSERDTALAESKAEIARLKGENYDLSIKVQASPHEDNKSDQDEDDEPTGIVSMFDWKKV